MGRSVCLVTHSEARQPDSSVGFLMLTWGFVREAEFSSIAILALSPLCGEKRLKKCDISVTMSDCIKKKKKTQTFLVLIIRPLLP